jgi:hypothetical protein
MMTDKDIGIIKEVIKERLEAPRHGVLECLEWGAGHSTLYFPRFIEESGRRGYTWDSIEHDPEWHRATMATIDGVYAKVTLCKLTPECYAQKPLSFGNRYDFVLVDGRLRRRCLITASKILAVGGVVVLHDAKREYYHSAFEHFTQWHFAGDDLWIGRIDAA